MASMIDGSKSAQEVFAEFLNSIANALMQTAAKKIAQYIALGIARMFAFGPGPGNFVPSGMLPSVGFVGPAGMGFDVGAMSPSSPLGMDWSFGARAMGGSVTAGQPYLVGEKGPELFTPSRSGGIAPAGTFGGDVNVTVDVNAIEQSINSIKQFLSPGFNAASAPSVAGGGAVKGIGTIGPNYELPARAMGGSVSRGQPYLVGERGPELFTPGRSGGIAPAGTFGGGMNIVVNVDAKGTKVEGDQQEGAALGRVISAAVQSELIKQQRPGGLLAGAR